MSDETRTVTVEQLADDVRYAGGNGTSDYWRGFNDGIDKLVQRLAALPTSTEGLDEVLARLDSAVTGWNGYNGDDLMPTVVAAHATLARLASLSPSPTEDPAR